MDDRDDPDTADVLAVAEGDREALGRLYDRHGPVLLAVAAHILRDRREAEDLLHDVFVTVWQRAGDYDPARGTVAVWLQLRVRSRALDRVRSARLARSVPLDALSVAEPRAAASQERAGDERVLRDALARLPGEQRMVLELGYFEGLSSAQIAARVGVPLGTVKSRVAAAIAKLRTQLGAHEGGAP
ncbi:MAG: sigma-70 family RNA polymerase sigma factor [Myxococcales bacterium]|nr:sigma-70 family RNA polymerase sigma factor [Myxococcales bacterium]